MKIYIFKVCSHKLFKLTKYCELCEKMSLSTTLSQKDYEIIHLTEDSPENNVWSSDCYIIKTKNSAIVIDPGYTRFDKARGLLKKIDVNNGIILLTHGHWDHWYAASDLLSNGFDKMYVHKKDDRYIKDLVALIKRGESTPETIENLSKNLSALHKNELNLKLDFLPANPNELNGFEEKIIYFDDEFTQLEYDGVLCDFQHDGGHTKGHVIYQIGRVLFAGDLIIPNNGIFRIEPRMDHKKPSVAREIREIRKAAKTAIREIFNNRSNIDYIALGHGGIITIEEFVEKARRYAS